MALVMLPCDLPWWPQLQRHLTQLALARTTKELIEGMQKIHNMCNIGLDPDEDDKPDLTVFCGLEEYLENDLTPEERLHLQEKTIPNMVHHALQLKQLKPPGGLHFSLQQQADRVELERSFVASLLAIGFFSTFPKRTLKTHPTLQDFNFSNFFKHLKSNSQKAKLRCILHYFDILEQTNQLQNKLVFSRQVMSSKNWLTIEDWLESTLPLCPLTIKHEGKLDRADPSLLRVCFSENHLGGLVLHEGSSQECVQFSTHPELIVLLSYVEALEDNEALLAEGILQVARIADPHYRAVFEPIFEPISVSVCCMDPENYMKLPLSQFEEDNVLRDLNKALLAFRQRQMPTPPQPSIRRLSPIGESFSSTPPEAEISPKTLKEEDCIGEGSSSVKTNPLLVCRDLLRPPSPETRRGRFIVLGSSGECLPVSRAPLIFDSRYSTCHSDSESSEEFHSARTSVEKEDEDSEGNARRYSSELDTPERRSTFAERLRDALKNETYSSSSTESSYAIGINVAGSKVGDREIKVRRGGSRGFVLHEDSLDDKFLKESLQQEREWIDRFRSKAGGFMKREESESSKHSFSSEFSSELEELYDQYSQWLQEVDSPDGFRELNSRDVAVIRFAGSLLKRTLSDSFAGISMTEPQGDMDTNKTKLALAARSLSLELARHKHRLASQMVNKQRSSTSSNKCGVQPIATGNWGCGSTHVGEPQLKLVIQWLAASVAEVPSLQYYTCAHRKLLKLDTVCRVLLDRQWTVGELTNAMLRFAQTTLNDPQPVISTLFDELIGTEKKQLQPTA